MERKSVDLLALVVLFSIVLLVHSADLESQRLNPSVVPRLEHHDES